MKCDSTMFFRVSICFYLLSTCCCFQVLICAPGANKVEHELFSVLALELFKSGHKVTYLSPREISSPDHEIQQIQYPLFGAMWETVKLFDLRHSHEYENKILDINLRLIDIFWSDVRSTDIWRERHQFDIIIADYKNSEAFFPFLIDFTGVFVQFSIRDLDISSLSRLGNWISPTILYEDDFSHHNSIFEKTNRFLTLATEKYNDISHIGKMGKFIKRHFIEFDDPFSYYDRVALTLINGHFALDGPVPLLPSQIEIGTINAKKPQPLPKDFEDFVQGSGEAGVIFFSLGSIAKSTDIPKEAKKMFIEAFKRIPQRVLWKYEGQDVELPSNVKSQKWMPQQDILGHPKTRLFISHCGNLGTQEAKYHGVPVLAVPIAFDQPRNAARMARKGYALVLQWEELTTDKIVDAINTLINDPVYKERLTTLSKVLQDQKDTPAERAVWWLEYVVRHKGAPHLQYAGKRLSLFQYIMLDVILFWLAVITGIILIFIYAIKLLCCGSKKSKAQNKKKKQ